MFIHLAWGWCQTCSPANMIMYIRSEWVRQKIYISHVSVTDPSAPYPHPVCFNLVSVATSFLFYSKHLLCSEIYFLDASPVWLKLMNITFCCDPLILLLCHNCWHFHSNSSAVVYRFSNASADNFELKLSSATVDFEATAKSSGSRSDFDLTSRGSGSKSYTSKKCGFLIRLLKCKTPTFR